MHVSSTNKKLFLSAVSSEFESYRRLLADDLKRPTLDVCNQSIGLRSVEERPNYFLRATAARQRAQVRQRCRGRWQIRNAGTKGLSPEKVAALRDAVLSVDTL